MKSILHIIAGTILGLYSINTNAEQSNVCRLANQSSKQSLATLFDKFGNISSGPMDFGNFPLSSEISRDLVEIPTGYMIAITPKDLIIEFCTASECMILRESKLKCPNAKIFDVYYGVSVDIGDKRPYTYTHPPTLVKLPVELGVGGLRFRLPKQSDWDTSVLANFDPTIQGVLISP